MSSTGKALLANDPHLGPAMPSVWYQVGLHCRTVSPACGYDLTGMSFPGVPAVLSGHNQRAGWAVTNLGPDVTDLVLEKIDETGYFVDGEHRPFTVIEDVIKVAGGDDVPITIRATEHGPLMSDVGETEQEIAADRSRPRRCARRGRGVRRCLPLDRAAARSALRGRPGAGHGCRTGRSSEQPQPTGTCRRRTSPTPTSEGNIGYQTPGQIPIRSGYSGKYPVPGWDSSYDWEGFIEFDALPNMLNPDSGLVITANNAAIGEQYPYLLTDDWDYGQRAQRITDLLEQATAGGKKLDRGGAVGHPARHLQHERGHARAADAVVGLGPRRADGEGVRAVRRAGTSTTTSTRRQLPTSTRSGATCRSRCSTTSSARTRARTAAAAGGSSPTTSGSAPTTRGGTTSRPRSRRGATPPWRRR